MASDLSEGDAQDGDSQLINMKEQYSWMMDDADVVELPNQEKIIDDASESILLFKFHSGNAPSLHVIEAQLKRAWNTSKSFSIRFADHNQEVFLVLFSDDKDMLRVLREGAWSIRSSRLLFEKFNHDIPIVKYPFDLLRFWIRIIGFTPALTNLDNIRFLAEKASDVLEIDWKPDKIPAYLITPRILIQVHAKKPLCLRCPVRDEKGTKKFVIFKYERLSVFCYKCGDIGHEGKNCVSENQVSKPIYGTWTRFSVTNDVLPPWFLQPNPNFNSSCNVSMTSGETCSTELSTDINSTYSRSTSQSVHIYDEKEAWWVKTMPEVALLYSQPRTIGATWYQKN